MPPSPNLHVFIGTKAQYIKTSPLLRLLQHREISYNLIDSGQHAALSPGFRRELGVKAPDIVLQQRGTIKSVVEATAWMARYLFLIVFRPGFIRKSIFRGMRGICIVHGDTVSTLIAVLAAKRARLDVALIEAGLRSYNLLRPFPEELIRLVCMRLGDYLFAPSDWAYQNMVKMHLKGRMFNIEQNTNVEAVYYSLTQRQGTPESPYCLMTIHRVETVLRKRRLEHVVALAERIAETMPVRFVMHDSTRKKLEDFKFLDRVINNSNIKTSPLMAHAKFVSLLANAEFVVTDGGSIQEESFYLDIPCLVVRTETERQEGLGANVCMSDFDLRISLEFLDNYGKYRRGQRVENNHPSEKILDLLLRT